MMNEINALVWPSPLGVGVLDPVFYGQTVRIAKNAGVIKNDPSPDAYDASIAKEALQAITDVDTKGADFKKGTVAGHAGRQLSPSPRLGDPSTGRPERAGPSFVPWRGRRARAHRTSDIRHIDTSTHKPAS